VRRDDHKEILPMYLKSKIVTGKQKVNPSTCSQLAPTAIVSLGRSVINTVQQL